ncbi:MAG: spermidine/putrescine ABC transporter substrate-binding protein [Gammaproteobacteria bacterium]|nr:spermidine/putrescine ABC transporter substrate-binding protein [Gammaproteobacteria bacterium]
MKKKITLNLCCLLGTLFSTIHLFAASKVLNIFAWAGEIPDQIVRQFEKETGIKVNLSTYANNEVLYAKLRASNNPGYDLILPSSYFVDRMRQQNMLLVLDKTKLPNYKNLNPDFLKPAYDPTGEYSIPYLWGVTGIFVNALYFDPKSIKKWTDLWDARFYNQLMVLDDIREIFSIALLSLGYPANDPNPAHIKEAYLKLKTFIRNVKVFSSDTVVSIMIDDDATVGTAWNGDTYKAWKENKNLHFLYPQDGFVIWVDNLSIPKTAPHPDTAYAFIDFLLRADIGKEVALATSYPTANLAAKNLLPEAVRNNATAYPPPEVMKKGQFQTDLGEDVLNQYEKYWEILKMGG